MNATHTEHRPGLLTDRCRSCAKYSRRLNLCTGCPESTRRVHLVVHVCPPGEQGKAGQMGLFR